MGVMIFFTTMILLPLFYTRTKYTIQCSLFTVNSCDYQDIKGRKAFHQIEVRNFEVKKELKRRYPKHEWPEDPISAEAVRGVKKRY